MNKQSSAFCFVSAAHIISTHGINGELVCQSAEGLPFILQEDMKVCLCPPLCKMESFTKVCSIREHKDAFLVSFESVDSLETAQQLLSLPNPQVLVSCAELLSWGFEQEDFEIEVEDELIGLEVYDKTAGFLGYVKEHIKGEYQSLLVLDSKSYPELLVPFVDAFVCSYDENSLLLDVPKDLLELNVDTSSELEV